jgi:hypothetical protein
MLSVITDRYLAAKESIVQELFHWLLMTFVLEPIQAEIDTTLRAANAAPAIIQQAQACVTEAAPALVRRAGDDWVWGARTMIGVATGLTEPTAVVAEASPGCRAAMQAVRPLLDGDAGA